ATIFVSTPAAGEGISVSTLSVETSSRGSSSSTVSPSCFSHRVTVPSVTLSPSAGIWTEVAMSFDSLERLVVTGSNAGPILSRRAASLAPDLHSFCSGTIDRGGARELRKEYGPVGTVQQVSRACGR